MLGQDPTRLPSFTVQDFLEFAQRTGLNSVPVQRIKRCRVLKFPFYHQFTVVTTVKFTSSDFIPFDATAFLQHFTKWSEEHDKPSIGSLNDIDPASHGVSFRIDRGRRSAIGIELSGSQQERIDAIEIIRPSSLFLNDEVAYKDYEITWLLSRQESRFPTALSLNVGDIVNIASWITDVSPTYDLFRRNCYTFSSSISHMILFHQFQHEMDLTDNSTLRARRASRDYFRRISTLLFGAPAQSLSWLGKNATARMDAVGEQHSIDSRGTFGFMSHPDRGGLAFVFSCRRQDTIVADSGFAKQSDEKLFWISLKIAVLVTNWRNEILANPVLGRDFCLALEEFAQLPMERSFLDLKADSRSAFLIALSKMYSTSGTPETLTEDMSRTVIASIPSFVQSMDRTDSHNFEMIRALLVFVNSVSQRKSEREALVHEDVLSVVVRIIRHKRKLAERINSLFETACVMLCNTDATTRKYILDSSALSYIVELMKRSSYPLSASLISLINYHVNLPSEDVEYTYNQLAYSGVAGPLAKSLALTKWYDKAQISAISVIWGMITNGKGPHLLKKPVLQDLAACLNNPFSTLAFGLMGLIFFKLCDLGPKAREAVVNSGALKGICRLAVAETYTINKMEDHHQTVVSLLGIIAQVNFKCAQAVEKARIKYGSHPYQVITNKRLKN